MDAWVPETDFSEIFLKVHHDVVLRHTYHQAQTWMLYPYGCEDLCVCAERRAQMLLSLNAAFYTQVETELSPEKLSAFRRSRVGNCNN